MKLAITITLLFISFMLHAQQPAAAAKPAPPVISFEIKAVAPDSFFLIQRITDVPTKDNPLPRTIETPIFFRSEKAWEDFLQKQRDKAAEDRKTAKNLVEDAAEREESTLKIEKEMNKHSGFFSKAKSN